MPSETIDSSGAGFCVFLSQFSHTTFCGWLLLLLSLLLLLPLLLLLLVVGLDWPDPMVYVVLFFRLIVAENDSKKMFFTSVLYCLSLCHSHLYKIET